MPVLKTLLALLALISPQAFGFGDSFEANQPIDLTAHSIGFVALAIFAISYVLVMAEEYTHLRKSKPVILAAGVIWLMIAIVYEAAGRPADAGAAVRHNLLEYTELMLFLLVAMTYINALQERRVFEWLRNWLLNRQIGFRGLFWMTGFMAFFVSPVADNLTTALIMCAVVMAVGGDNKRFISIACINIVVAANAGGAFSPFGDITTLMVWQKGMVEFSQFFALFIPSLVNFLVPAALMFLAIPKEKPKVKAEAVSMKYGAKRFIFLFALTILTAVVFHSFFHLPPVLGMMTGLGYLQLMAYYLKMCQMRKVKACMDKSLDPEQDELSHYDFFQMVSRAEWDTLLFFYGVVIAVGGLGFIGYLGLASEIMYNDWGPTSANILVGVMSAIVDNIPVMFAVLTMQPDMSLGQWLLVTLTAGVGGSLLSIGSAAGVALMGQARGYYTFLGHLKWTPVIALGYFASIAAHLWINAGSF